MRDVFLTVSLAPAYAYLEDRLADRGLDEPEFTAAILQQITGTILTLGQPWESSHSVEAVYEQIIEATGKPPDDIAAVVRTTDDLITQEIACLWPTFSSNPPHVNVSYTFVNNTDVRIRVSAHPAQAPDLRSDNQTQAGQ